MKTVALLPAHPAQLWLMMSIADAIRDRYRVVWVLRDKDILIELADLKGLEYTVISQAQTGLVGNLLELARNILRAWVITRRQNVDLWLTKYGCGNIAATLSGRKSLSFNDDDIETVPLIALTSYPFCQRIIAPDWVTLGRYSHKALRYTGTHELIYLHPNRFLPDRTRLADTRQCRGEKPYIIIRLSALKAHHDVGIRGVSLAFIDHLIKRYADSHEIVISSEKSLDACYQPYLTSFRIDQMHHALAFADCLITDSLTMALEAAVLGTATLRLSDFGNEISAFAAIRRFELIHNFAPDQTAEVAEKLAEILSDPAVYSQRRDRLIEHLDDPLPTFVGEIDAQLD